MKRHLLVVLLAASLTRAVSAKKGGRVFADGSLGSVSNAGGNDQGLVDNTKKTLSKIVKQKFGGTGNEQFKDATNNNKVVKDNRGHSHVRLEQTYEGLEVVDAAVVVHVDANGTVYAVNGEVVADGSVDVNVRFSCNDAFSSTLADPKYGNAATWLSDCALKIVLDKDGVAHKAWERMIGYPLQDHPYQNDKLYASTATGALVATRPQILGARSLRTENCQQSSSTAACLLVSQSPNAISTGDAAVDAAHNLAMATYDYFKTVHGRDSIDNAGMTIKSRAHVGLSYNNAYWNGNSVNYGDGDGVYFSYLSGSPDIIGHEVTHGVTQYTSGLAYQDESGAMNEAMSDIFGACIDRYLGASVANTWMLGELSWTPSTAGDALRYMNDPKRAGDYDWYPTRYIGTSDNGGVHWNSGIMNLAFVLMVQGGTHPRARSTVVVPAIDVDFDKSLLAASKIFYLANTACLTPMSTFLDARRCTILHAGPYLASVQAAWSAVGVDLTSSNPTKAPTKRPTKAPTRSPTKAPTNPTKSPTKKPTKAPTRKPTKAPTRAPTKKPTKAPTRTPTKSPTRAPVITSAPIPGTTKAPTRAPTKAPTKAPTPRTAAPTKACRPAGAACSMSSECCGYKATCDKKFSRTKTCRQSVRLRSRAGHA